MLYSLLYSLLITAATLPLLTVGEDACADWQQSRADRLLWFLDAPDSTIQNEPVFPDSNCYADAMGPISKQYVDQIDTQEAKMSDLRGPFWISNMVYFGHELEKSIYIEKGRWYVLQMRDALGGFVVLSEDMQKMWVPYEYRTTQVITDSQFGIHNACARWNIWYSNPENTMMKMGLGPAKCVMSLNRTEKSVDFGLGYAYANYTNGQSWNYCEAKDMTDRLKDRWWWFIGDENGKMAAHWVLLENDEAVDNFISKKGSFLQTDNLQPGFACEECGKECRNATPTMTTTNGRDCTCTTCTTGFKLEDGVCRAPMCSCPNGTGLEVAPWQLKEQSVSLTEFCRTDGSCVKCNPGFHINYTAYTCEANTCSCDKGSPATGSACSTDGIAKCADCDAGYSLKGAICTACTAVDNCDATTCEANDTNSKCTDCSAGFQVNNAGTCSDINECDLEDTHACHEDAVCTNSAGAYSCACRAGYYGDGTNCTACTAVDNCGATTCEANDTKSKCTDCSTGFHLSDGKCPANTCDCEHGTPATGGQGGGCVVNGASTCSGCDDGFDLRDGACIADKSATGVEGDGVAIKGTVAADAQAEREKLKEAKAEAPKDMDSGVQPFFYAFAGLIVAGLVLAL